jgi:hypothetical protein
MAPWDFMISAVEEFLSLLLAPPETDSTRLKKLAEALDKLACAYHKLPEGAAYSSEVPADLTSYGDMREAAARVFPEFGFYAVVPPEPNPDVAVLMGDAIDDLADIALEMKQVEWLWTNVESQDAERHFRFGYQIHWGRHLRELQSYVHALQFES